MTGMELRDLFLSSEFKQGLEEMSSYLASVMQEAPIVHLLAKYLWQQKHIYALERNKHHDLTVWPSLPSKEKETTIEFKFNYETCAEKLGKELAKLTGNLDPIVIEAKFSTWDVVRGICKDVFTKKPDIFVWIVCSRDISKLTADDLTRIPYSKPLKKYQRLHPYGTGREFLVTTIDGFLQRLRKVPKVKPFSISEAEIETEGFFPSTYHFRICDFRRP